MKSRYRISIFGDAVLQVEIDGLTETYWRDAKLTDLPLKNITPEIHRKNWLGKLVLNQDLWTTYITQDQI